MSERIEGLTEPPETSDDRILRRALSIQMTFGGGMDVKPGECAACPCGEIPERLCIVEQGGRWAMVSGACCGEWHIEFRAQYKPMGSPELNALALEAWNAAPRAPVTKPCWITPEA